MERYLKKESGMSTNDAEPFIELPPVPPLSVPREEKVNEFKHNLRNLKPGKHLALHGLKGFGKSCLTVIALKDKELVAELFENQIYWLKFSYTSKKLEEGLIVHENKVNEEILIQLNELAQRIKKSDTLPTPLKSETLKECLLRIIKFHFSQTQNKNSLLILDDVCHKKIVDTFVFGCKTLVITDDLSVVKERRPIKFQLHGGFSLAESLGLFAKVLDIQVDRLPPEAKQIHVECKGMPLLISMFAGQFEEFKEDMSKNRERWQYYLDRLRKKDPKNRAIQERTAIFDMCIEKLKPPELKKMYYELAIFNEDVNIMPKTLEILWGVEPLEVDEYMLIFCHKSLAARRWNEELNSYVYGVHDLLLSHLKMKLNSLKLKEKHRLFIRKNREACRGDFSKLPDDNYIYSYVGHHLEQGRLYHLFPKVYLNLEFVQAKILTVGLSDFLIDIAKYKQYISGKSNEHEIKRANLEQFLKSKINLIIKYSIKNCLDLVQIALMYEKKGFVFDASRQLANKRNSDLYFSNSKHLGNEGVTSLENVSTESTVDSYVEDISALCYTDDPNSLLLASKKGEIILKNVETKKSNYFHGFIGKNIIKLVLSHVGNYFLALTDEGTAKLFCINEEENDNGNNDRSPREKQKIWTGVFTNKHNEDDSLKTFSIEQDDKLSDVAFSQCDKFVAGCTTKNIIHIWKESGEEFQTLKLTPGICLEKISFTSDLQKNILMHVIGNNGVLISYKFCNTSFQYMSHYNPQIKEEDKDSVRIVFFKRMPKEYDSVIIVTEKKAVLIKWSQSSTQIHSYTRKGGTTIEDQNSIFVGATVTYDGQYLITAKSDGHDEVWDIQNNFTRVAIYKVGIQTRSCLDTYWMEEEGYHLFCRNENRLIHKWQLKRIDIPKPLKKPLFNALMKPLGQDDMVVRRTSENRLAIYKGSQIAWRKIAETDIVDGTFKTMIFTSDGSKVIYEVLKDQQQEIFIFDIETQTSMRMKQSGNISKLIKSINNLETGVVVFEERDNLRIWTEKVSNLQVINGPGEVISVHEMAPNEILTVKKKFMIGYWNIWGNEWTRETQNDNLKNSNAISSNVSPGKTYLAVLNENQKELVLYVKIKNHEVTPAQVSINFYEHYSFETNVTCYEFSENEQYLAIGFDDGNISILDIAERKEIQKLSLHCNPVCELHWAPVCIKAPILLSVNADELIWWNVEPVLKQNCRRKSRMGFTGILDNVPSPKSSLRLKNDQSNAVHLSDDTDSNNGTNDIDNLSQKTNGNLKTPKMTDSVEFWNSKVFKEGQPGLLGLVPLPSSTAKVCVSEDFKKFLIINSTEHINILQPFGLSDI
ncbi:apoptotic protease-activating factor 1-like [Belonocnema kinseyi]|uniref:apoptotic protease-activating factor 1-like n=1 Tax=Belonocnema kinseyi TaxID=2817044 RepID=UPI00143DB2F7|nr:apoptotic protease-activating factor 1-like [Belonocnema kinseyi]